MTIKRKTIQQAITLEMVNKLQSHATADEVYNAIKEEHPTISRATVYRNLNQLALDDQIKKIEVPGGADRFDHRCFPHYHAKCLKCGKIYDVNMKYLPHLENKIEDTQGFKFYDHDIMFHGICLECNQSHNTNKEDKQ